MNVRRFDLNGKLLAAAVASVLWLGAWVYHETVDTAKVKAALIPQVAEHGEQLKAHAAELEQLKITHAVAVETQRQTAEVLRELRAQQLEILTRERK